MMPNNIDQLKTEVDDIKNSLNKLKNNVSLSEEEKKKQVEEIKSRAEITKKKIENKIDSLENKTDEESKKEKEKAKTLLNSFNETMSLYASILNPQESQITQKQEEKQDTKQNDEKWILTKAKEWIWEQWEEAKENPWKYILGATGLIAAWYAIKKVWNRAFWDKDEDNEEKSQSKSKRKKKKDKSSWWKKWVTAVLAWVVWFFWYKNWDKIKEFWGNIRDKIKWWFENEKPLEFDEAVKSASSEVRNWKIKENPFRQHFEWWIKFNEWDSTIESYREATKIDVKNKTIEWLKNIEFPNYEELVHAANIINFARRNFARKCQSSEPFEISDCWGGDLVVHLANWEKPEWISASGSNLWTKILWIWWCAIWTALWAYIWWIKWAFWLWVTLWLWWAVAWDYIDDDSSVWNAAWSVASWTNLKRFKNCLNEQKDAKWNSLWPKKSHQEVNPDNTSPIEKELNEIIKEIEWSWWEWTWWRDLKLEQNKENPEVFTISSYGQNVDITLKWCTQTWSEHIDYSKIRSIKIWKYRKDDRWDWLEIDFSHDKEWLKEAIRVINFTNFIRLDTNFAWNWWEIYPFVYWKYKVPFALDMDIDGMWWKAVLSHNALTTKFPTIYKDLQKQFCKTDQEKLRSQAYNNKNSKWYGSYYIRYLHQMRNEFDSQSYWINWEQ